MPRGPREGVVPRRRILRALAIAPAALAGCAAASAGRPVADAATLAPATGPAEPRRSLGEAAEAVRRFALAADAEPASLFRAVAARPGEPR